MFVFACLKFIFIPLKNLIDMSPLMAKGCIF